MSTQNTRRFADVAILIESATTPGSYTAPCGLTSHTWTTSTSETSEDLPDCADPDKVGYTSPIVTAVGDQIAFQGFVDTTNSDLWYEWAHSGEARNVRVAYTKAPKLGHYQGPAVCTAREESYERRASGKISGTIKFQSPPAWTADS